MLGAGMIMLLIDSRCDLNRNEKSNDFDSFVIPRDAIQVTRV